MMNLDDVILDCRTCVASNTTACSECVVSHLLANDAGPINFVPIALSRDVDRVVALFGAAGLLDHEPRWVNVADFEAGCMPQVVCPPVGEVVDSDSVRRLASMTQPTR
jgi:hypothetical protein